MRQFTYLILSLLMCVAVRPGNCANNAGTATAAFLKLPVDARSVGMGEAVVGSPSGAMALFQNPAGLTNNKTTAFAFSHALMMEDISYDVIGAAVPIGDKGVIGIGAQYMKYGSFDSLDNTGASAGTLAPKDSAFALGWGMRINSDIIAGAAVKYIDSEIYSSADTMAVDVGILMKGDDISLGFAMQNLGKGMKFNNEVSSLPVNVKFGIYIPANVDLDLFADINFPKDGSTWLAIGGEYAFYRKDDWILFGRTGYNNAANDTDGINGISAGFGLAKNNLTFDYAFKTMGLLGSTHHIGLTYLLGK
jgi:hypothetical protein